MYDFNLETREINIENLINEYERILLDTGILTRLKKTTNPKKKQVISKTALELLADLDPVSKDGTNSYTFDKVQIKDCPPDKELNLATNRCVKKCQPGQIRNEKFRCVSSKANANVNANVETIRKTRAKTNANENVKAETIKKTRAKTNAEPMAKSEIKTRAKTQKYRKK
jgi:hypothetical protein